MPILATVPGPSAKMGAEKAWRDDSAVNNTGCSFREPIFSFYYLPDG